MLTLKAAIPGLLLLCFLFACKKEGFISSADAHLSFSADTIKFDTVFTTVGSVTRSVKIFNDNDQKLLLSDVHLMGGSASPYVINIDGAPATQQSNIEIDAHDSIYVFVSVRIDPNAANLPFVVQDSIRVAFNGNSKFIQLQAWGQNAHFLDGQVIHGTTIWSNDLPYVILGSLQVDTTASLTIEKGCKIYFHANAPMLIDGTLNVTGEKSDSTRVYFQSDRLDDPYNGFPGSWPGIFFRETSKDNKMEYAVVQNAYQGIISLGPTLTANPKLVLNECIIDNIYDAGILEIQSSLSATNCLVSNCGKNIEVAYGGDYQFIHCTVASYSNDYIMHKNPVLSLSDNISDGSSTFTGPLDAVFENCIFWGANGTIDDEVVVSKQGTDFSASFKNCLWKIKNDPAGVDTSNMIVNQDPLFDSVNSFKRMYNFRLKANSPAVDRGLDAGVTIDLDGATRPVNLPDLGSYERHP